LIKNILTIKKNISHGLAFFLVTIFTTLISCKVTDKSVAGTYADNLGHKIVLMPNNTCKIDVEIPVDRDITEDGEILDTVLTILRGTEVITGQWRLNDNDILFNMDDKNYKYIDSVSYKVKGKKIITPAFNLHIGTIKTYKWTKSK